MKTTVVYLSALTQSRSESKEWVKGPMMLITVQSTAQLSDEMMHPLLFTGQEGESTCSTPRDNVPMADPHCVFCHGSYRISLVVGGLSFGRRGHEKSIQGCSNIPISSGGLQEGRKRSVNGLLSMNLILLFSQSD